MSEVPKKQSRKKPRFTLLQLLALVAVIGIVLTVAHQYGYL